MSFLSNIVGLINGVITPLGFQTDVMIERYMGPTGMSGEPSYGPPTKIHVVLEQKQRSVKTANGKVEASSVTLTFTDIPALRAATPAVMLLTGGVNAEGQLVPDDRITLPDGTQQGILSTGGFIDYETGQPVCCEVYLG